MGDVRFDAAYKDVRDAIDRPGILRRMSESTLIGALAAASRHDDPYLANVLATETINRVEQKNVILDRIGECVVALDLDGSIAYANSAAETELGWSRTELLGRDFHDVVDHRRATHASLDDARIQRLPRGECQLLRILQTHQALAVEDHDVFHRKDGSRFLVGFNGAPYHREGALVGVVIVFRDVTERLRDRERLETFRTAFDLAPQAIFWIEESGRFRYVNRRATEHLGYPEPELLTKSVWDIDALFDPAKWARSWAETKRQGTRTLESVHLRSDGTQVPVHIQVTHVEHGGREFHCAFATPREASRARSAAAAPPHQEP